MPRGDRTGPWGRGSMTGRGLGYCAGFPGPGYSRGIGRGRGMGRGYGYGRGWGGGRGFGRGRGWGRPYDIYDEPYYGPEAVYPYPRVEPPAPEEEKGYLKNVLADLEEQVKAVKDRIKDLAKGKKTE